jgi:hypothetical protein
MDCKSYPLNPPRIVATAVDFNPTRPNSFDDSFLPAPYKPGYGQDLTFGTGGKPPEPRDVGSSETVLKPKMEKLLGVFASDDKSGMAKRLFDKFLAKQTAVIYFDDADLNKAADAHANIKSFITAALAPPGTSPPAGKTRIHQALKTAGWDINKLVAPSDLGPPALNLGNKVLRTQDWGNGLAVMIDGIQLVFVVATHYHYEPGDGKYCITLNYRFYDVFGLDDEDVKTFGAEKDGWSHTDAGVGITAWWQLQHQFNYAPLVTRIILEKTFNDVPAT